MTTEHPTLDQLYSFLDGRGTAAHRAAVAKHVQSGCGPCRQASDRMRPLLRSLVEDRLEALPDAVKREVLAGLASERRRRPGRPSLAGVIERIASVVLDSGSAPALAGVRGAASPGAVAPVRHLIFESDSNRFAVRVERSSDRASYDLLGQILLTDGEPGGLPVTLQPERGRTRSVDSGATGEFAFVGVRPGRYALRVKTDQGPVTLPGIELA